MGETNPPSAAPEVEVPQETEPAVQNIVSPAKEVDDDGFGGFGDFDQDVQKHTPKKASGDDDGFGDFGDFKDGPTADKKETPVDEFEQFNDQEEADIGFGHFDSLAEPKPSGDVKKQIMEPESPKVVENKDTANMMSLADDPFADLMGDTPDQPKPTDIFGNQETPKQAEMQMTPQENEDNGFGDFANEEQKPKQAQVEEPEDDPFGDFGDFNEATEEVVEEKPQNDGFGDFDTFN